MPYKSSLSRKDFIQETNQILETSRKASLKKTGIPNPAIDMILQAAIFKTSAHLEEYLKSTVSDWIFNALENDSSAKTLPDELRWFFISNSYLNEYKRFIYTNDESRLITDLKVKKENLLHDDSQAISGLIHPMVILGNRKYPSIKNIKSLFNRIGISNIFQKIDKKTHRAFEPILRSFLDVRESIAHQNPPNLTLKDVVDHIRNIQILVSAIDRVLFSHVVACHGSQCWRTN
ncbi:hypothetical protein KA005_55135 [bacterium]|nr:hypothetical protein [bacterium]